MIFHHEIFYEYERTHKGFASRMVSIEKVHWLKKTWRFLSQQLSVCTLHHWYWQSWDIGWQSQSETWGRCARLHARTVPLQRFREEFGAFVQSRASSLETQSSEAGKWTWTGSSLDSGAKLPFEAKFLLASRQARFTPATPTEGNTSGHLEEIDELQRVARLQSVEWAYK